MPMTVSRALSLAVLAAVAMIPAANAQNSAACKCPRHYGRPTTRIGELKRAYADCRCSPGGVGYGGLHYARQVPDDHFHGRGHEPKVAPRHPP
jgi:hypothetical protein